MRRGPRQRTLSSLIIGPVASTAARGCGRALVSLSWPCRPGGPGKWGSNDDCRKEIGRRRPQMVCAVCHRLSAGALGAERFLRALTGPTSSHPTSRRSMSSRLRRSRMGAIPRRSSARRANSRRFHGQCLRGLQARIPPRFRLDNGEGKFTAQRNLRSTTLGKTVTRNFHFKSENRI